jgi:hypothetical protein
MIQKLSKAAFKIKENDKKKSKLGTKEFFEKKSMIRSFLKRPYSKLSATAI